MDVWQIDLAQAGELKPWLDLLDEREQQQAARFRFAEHGRRYIVAHAALRLILSEYKRLPADQLCFEYNSYGKPSLLNHGGLSFNLSHSDDLALCAVADGGDIGVDIERCRAIAWRDMAGRFFSRAEAAFFDSLDPAESAAPFFSCWTRKEAYIKAKGLGLSLPLAAFSVECDPALPPALTASDFAPEDVGRFRLWDVAVAGEAGQHYRAALAYAGKQAGPPACRLWMAAATV